MMDTPKSEMKPTAAEMLKVVPVRKSAQTPPIEAARTLPSTTTASSQERRAEYKSARISPSDMGTIHNNRVWASCICSNSPDQTAR